MTRCDLHFFLAGGFAALLLILFSSGPFSSSAEAADFKLGSVDVKFDNTVSFGLGIRTSGRDCSFIGLDNGGCTSTGNVRSNNQGKGGNGYEFQVNFDDGNINTGRWEPYSIVAKLVSELELRYENYGAFIRGKFYYDYWGSEELGRNGGRFGMRPLSDAWRGTQVRKANNGAGHGAKLLDAFVFANWNMGDSSLSLRAGNQVVNWGESLFIQGGVNSFLPIDVGAIRTPGSELRDAYQPAPMLYASLTLPDGFGLEGFYQLASMRTTLDSCGTFFSTNDGFCQGGAYIMNGFEYNHPVAALGGAPSQLVPGLILPRIESQYARNSGQFGVKGSYFADWLNDGTDLALYFVNFHSPMPIGTFTATTTPFNAAQVCAGVGVPLAAPAAACLSPAVVPAILLAGAGSKYSLTQYPEDIRMFSMSFNTSLSDFLFLGGTALSGEFSYSPNMAFQVADTEVNANDLALVKLDALAAVAAAGGTVMDANIAAALAGTSTLLTSGRALTPRGAVIRGYDRENVITGQISTISTLQGSNPVTEFLGADTVPILFNLGFQALPNLDSRYLLVPRGSAYHYNALVDGLLGSGACPGLTGTPPQGTCGSVNYASSFSWGYRLALIAQYNNAFNTAWSVSPTIQWAHDVKGYSAGPIGPGFIEGKKSVSLGVSASLLNTWQASVQWTSSFGNKLQNFAYDKDFATVTVSYSF